MSAHMTAPDEMLLKVLDFEPTLPCERTNAAGERCCGERASWLIRCKKCKQGSTLCHPHKVEAIAKAATWRKPKCLVCGHASRRLDDVMDILPLRNAL